MTEKIFTTEVYENVVTSPPVAKGTKTSSSLRRSIKNSLEEKYSEAIFEEYEADNMLESIGIYGVLEQNNDSDDFVAVEINPEKSKVYLMAHGPSDQLEEVDYMLSNSLDEWRDRGQSNPNPGFGHPGL